MRAISSLRYRILTLGLHRRRIVFNRAKRRISISTLYLWFIDRRRRLSFNKVAAILYGYENLNPESSYALAHDGMDWFAVGLRLYAGEHDFEEIKLFNFLGEGTFVNEGPLPDWMYWDDIHFDLSGSQEKESRIFVELLSKMIEVPIERPRY